MEICTIWSGKKIWKRNKVLCALPQSVPRPRKGWEKDQNLPHSCPTLMLLNYLHVRNQSHQMDKYIVYLDKYPFKLPLKQPLHSSQSRPPPTSMTNFPLSSYLPHSSTPFLYHLEHHLLTPSPLSFSFDP